MSADLAGIDLAQLQAKPLSAEQFREMWDRCIERIKAENTKPQYIMARTVEEGMRKLGYAQDG